MSIQNATLIKKGLAFGGTIPDYSSAIGYKESIGSTCRNPSGYTVGSFFVGSNDGYFYKVTSAIAYGDTLTVGTNCEQTSVAYELANGSSTNVSYDNTSSGMTATDVQDAIDELSANIGGFKFVAMTTAEHDALTEDLPDGTVCLCYEATT